MITTALTDNLTDTPRSRDQLLNELKVAYQKQFPTSEDSFEAIVDHAEKCGLVRCEHCGHTEVRRRHGKTFIVCMKCHKRTWFLADTLFGYMKSPRIWHAGIWLLQQGITVNSKELEWFTGCANSSAQNAFKKIMMVVLDTLNEGAVQVSSSLFGPLFRRRSRETPARAHPSAEQTDLHQRDPEDNRAQSSASGHFWQAESEDIGNSNRSSGHKQANPIDNLCEEHLLFLNALSNAPLHFNDLCVRLNSDAGIVSAIMTLLEIQGLIDRLPGDYYRLKEDDKESQTASIDHDHIDVIDEESFVLIERAVNFVLSHFGGVSRKACQLYIAAFSSSINVAAWESNGLFKACFEFAHLSDRGLLQYVTPAVVHLRC